MIRFFLKTLQHLYECVRSIHVDVLCLGRHVQVQLKNTRHVMKEHVEVLLVLADDPLLHTAMNFLQKGNVMVREVTDSCQPLILEYDEVSSVVAVVLVCTQAPLVSLQKYLLSLRTKLASDDVEDPLRGG